MNISKEERQQARIDIRSWGADEKPELVERLLNALDEADSEKAKLQAEIKSLYQAAAEDRKDVEDTLAQALNYPHDEVYGYAIGDHVATSLAGEASRRIGELQRESERLRIGLQGLRQALTEHFTNVHIQQEPLPAGHAYLNRIDVLLGGDVRDWRRS